MSNLDRAIAIIKSRYGACYGEANLTVEQYMFGFVKSYAVVTTNDQRCPFKVVSFDNVESVKGIRHFDSRVDAHKYASECWLAHFK